MRTRAFILSSLLAFFGPVLSHADYCQQEFDQGVAGFERQFQYCESSGLYTDQQCQDEYQANYQEAEDEYNNCEGPPNCNESYTCYGPNAVFVSKDQAGIMTGSFDVLLLIEPSKLRAV